MASSQRNSDHDPRRPQVVEAVMEGAGDGPLSHHCQAGVLESIRMHQPAGGSAEAVGKLGREVGDDFECSLHNPPGQVAHLGEGVGTHHGTDSQRRVGIESLPGHEVGKVGVDDPLVGDVDPLNCVSQSEPVHANHHRNRELFGDPEGLQV